MRVYTALAAIKLILNAIWNDSWSLMVLVNVELHQHQIDINNIRVLCYLIEMTLI